MTAHILNREDPQLAHHALNSTVLVAAAYQIDLLLRARATPAHDQVELHGVRFTDPAVLASTGSTAEVNSHDDLLILEVDGVATARAEHRTSTLEAPDYQEMPDAWSHSDYETFTAWLEHQCPMTYGAEYRVVRALRDQTTTVGRRVTALVRPTTDTHVEQFCPPPLMDSLFQLLAYASGAPNGGGLPWAIRSVHARRPIRGSLRAVVEVTSPPAQEGDRPRPVTGNASLLTEQGEAVVTMRGITLMPPPAADDNPIQQVTGQIRTHNWAVPSRATTHPATSTALVATHTVPVECATGPAQLLIDTIKGLRAHLTGPNRPGYVRVITTAAIERTGHRADPAHAAVRSMLHAVRAENPTSTVQWVDLPAGTNLNQLPAPPADATETAWADETWLVPDQPQRIILEPRSTVPQPAKHLIIGGLGAIGTAVAAHLLRAGHEVTLTSRHDPNPAQARLIHQLQQTGDLRHVIHDVADPTTNLTDLGHFETVIHAAGVLRDSLLATVTPEQVTTVMTPKVGGCAALKLYTQAHPDTRVVLFSSIASVEGHLGQTVYGAANGYLDAVAQQETHDGRNWYSLRWGLWNIGMGADIHESAAAAGFPVLDTTTGPELMEYALSLPPGVYDLLGPVPVSTPTTTDAAEASGDAMTTNAPPAPQHLNDSPVLDLLRAALQTVLSQPNVEPTDSLVDLGIDSMMAVEVSSTLADQGVTLEPADLFAADTVQDVSALARATDAPAATPQTVPEHPEGPSPSTAEPAAQPNNQAAPENHSSWDQFRATTPATAPDTTPAPIPHTPEPTPSPASGAPTPPTTRAEPAARPTRTLPNRLTAHVGGEPFQARIDELSTEDRQLVAEGGYFYEPVVQDSHGSQIQVDGQWMLNFASYSYLGLIENEYIQQQAMNELRRSGTGAHGVRLLAGTATVHRRLEQRLADFLGHEDAIVFSSGYMANVATIGAIASPNDVIVGDVYNHASILDGYRLSGAETIPYAHNDMRDLERALRKAADRRTLLVTDAVFSMDGDIADLPAIKALADQYHATVMVDEAHSLGVLGPTGRGIVEHYQMAPQDVDIAMGTLSKTIPSAGGYVAGSSDLIFALKNNARGWMFSAALPPTQAAAALAAVDLIAAAPQRVIDLHNLTACYRNELHRLGFDTMLSDSPVVPIRCKSSEQAIAMARRCQQLGLFVQPITYPTVPKAAPRLRTIINLTHTQDEIEHALNVFTRVGHELDLI